MEKQLLINSETPVSENTSDQIEVSDIDSEIEKDKEALFIFIAFFVINIMFFFALIFALMNENQLVIFFVITTCVLICLLVIRVICNRWKNNRAMI